MEYFYLWLFMQLCLKMSSIWYTIEQFAVRQVLYYFFFQYSFYFYKTNNKFSKLGLIFFCSEATISLFSNLVTPKIIFFYQVENVHECLSNTFQVCILLNLLSLENDLSFFLTGRNHISIQFITILLFHDFFNHYI